MDDSNDLSIISRLTKNTKPTLIQVIKGRGAIFYDHNRKVYLDFSSQTLNLNFGQLHPKITAAVVNQARNLTFLSSRFINPVLLDVARELLEISPPNLIKINLKLVNGSDANESAFKRVRKLHNKQYIIAFQKTHLGESSETLSASAKTAKYIGGSGKFLFVIPPFEQFFKGNSKSRDLNEYSLHEINQLLKKRDNIAGIILEPVMVNAGVYGFSSYYLRQLREMCQRYSISLIFDEVQTAFGWLGTYFAADYFGVAPDLLTMGKGLAAGYPLAAILMKEEYDVIDYGEDEYTYGGHPVSLAAALACIKLLKETDILVEVKRKAKLLLEQLLNLQKQHSCISDIRGFGLICAIEFTNSQDQNLANKIYDKCLENGLVLRKTENSTSTSLVLKPPLIVTDKQIENAISTLDQAILSITKNK